jgi:hypothetical protein
LQAEGATALYPKVLIIVATKLGHGEKFKTETELRQHKNLHTYTLHAYTHIHYRRLADLVRNGLIIRKDGSRKYILSSLGKVVYSNLLSIQYIVDNIWKFKAIDAIEVCDDEIYKGVARFLMD